MGKHLSFYLAPGLPAPTKPHPRPRAVLKVERGERFGRLVVMLETVRPKGPAAVCRCDCGNAKTVLLARLRDGSTQSCGCMRADVAKLGAAKRWAKARA